MKGHLVRSRRPVWLLLALLLVGSALLAPQPAHAATVTWEGDSGTNWNTPANWNTGTVPTASDDVVIPNVAGSDPTISSPNVTINSLDVQSGAIVTIGNGRTLTSNSTTVAGQINFSGTSNFVGNATVSGTLRVNSSATGNFTGNITLTGTVNGGNSSSTFNFNGASFANNGTVTVGIFRFNASGAQSVSGAGTWTGSQLNTNSSSTLTLASAVTFDNPTFTLNGPLNFAGNTLTFDGGTFNNNATSTLDLSGAALGFNSGTTFTNNGTLDRGTGTLTFNGSTLNNNGTFALGSSPFTFSNATFNNNFDVTGSSTFQTQGTVTLINGGNFAPALNVDTGTTTAAGSFAGAITVDAGATLRVEGFYSLASGVGITVDGTLSVAANGSAGLDGNLTLNSGATLSGGNANSSLSYAGPTLINNGAVTVASFYFNGTGTQSVGGSGTWTGSYMQVSPGSTLALTSNVTFDATDFYLYGTLNLAGGVLTFDGGTFYNFSATTLALNTSQFVFNGSALYNQETIDLGGAPYTLNNVTFTNLGTVTGVALNTQGTSTVYASGGSFLVPLQVLSGTTVAAGSFDAAITVDAGATLQIPVFNQVIANNGVTVNGTLTIAAGEFGTLDGDLTLNGTLNGGDASSTLYFEGSTLVNNGSVTIPYFYFNGGGPQTLSGTGTWTGAELALNNNVTLTLADSVTFSVTQFQVDNTATLDLGTATLTFNGSNFNTSGTVTGGIFRTQGTPTVSAGSSSFLSPLNVASGTTTAGGIFDAAITVDAGATLQPPANFGTLTANNGVTVNGALNVPANNAGTLEGDLTLNGTLSGGNSSSTLYFKGSTLVNNGSVTIGVFVFDGTSGPQTLSGAGTWTGPDVQVSTGSTLTLANDVTFDVGEFYNGGTVNGTGTFRAQNTMTLSQVGTLFSVPLVVETGTLTADGNLRGDVTINAGATLRPPVFASGLSFAANFTNNGTFTPNSQTATFNGSAAQSIGGTSSTTFYGLAINNAAGVTLNTSGTVTFELALTSGDLTTGATTLTMASSATTTGTFDVVGTVRRVGPFGLGTQYTFGSTYTVITFNVGASRPSEIVVNMVKTVPSGFPNAIQRTYTITPTGGGAFSATLRLHYRDAELNGNVEANLQPYRYDGTAWTLQTRTSINTTQNWVERSGVTAFSPWTLAASGPTDVLLADFAATAMQEHILVTWETVSEVSNAGFNLYRATSPDEPQEQLNEALIPSQAPGSGQGFVYEWVDATADAGVTYYYWLEDVDTSGATTLHGPVSATITPPTAVTIAALEARSGNGTALAWLLGLLSLAGWLVWRRR